jgi:beta-lactamase class D
MAIRRDAMIEAHVPRFLGCSWLVPRGGVSAMDRYSPGPAPGHHRTTRMTDEILPLARKKSGRLGVDLGVPTSTRVALLLTLTVPIAATNVAVAGPPAPPDPFAARGVQGAFVLLDTSTETWTILHRPLAETRFHPQSTFKVPNTLIGLETGVITGERFTLRWDGIKRDRAAWNRDHDLASALRESVVWYYQEVARRVGPRRMRTWVDRLGYGDRKVAGGKIDRFWLEGPLRISAVEQVDFLRRLHEHRLPVSRAHADLLLRLLELDRGAGWVLRGKTGLGWDGGRAVGWLVGSVDRDGRRFLYALVLRADTLEKLLPLRRPLAEELLRRVGVLPAT